MKHKGLMIMIFVLRLSTAAYGQSDAITWKTESMKVLRSNEEFPFTSTFTIYPNDRIEWTQGDKISTYTITSTDDDSQGSGVVTYDITRDGIHGKIIVEMISQEQTNLTLDLSGGTVVGAYCLFKVFNP
jgi:hypothetical protein